MEWNEQDRQIGYWVGALTLTLGGLVAMLGLLWMGIPAFVLGVTLIAMGRVRARPRVFWPILAGSA
jgi:hypothetical protein